MTDCKHIHKEPLIRHEYDWKDGWKPGTTWLTGMLWGVNLMIVIVWVVG